MEKNKAIVKIRNKEYTIMSADSQEYILSVANELNNRINELVESNSALNTERLIMLTSLNLCDEYMKLSKAYEELKLQVTDGSESKRKNADENTDKLQSELETARERIKLLEMQLSDDDKKKNEIETLKKRIDEASKENETIKASYESKIKQLEKKFAEKEQEFLEMIDKM